MRASLRARSWLVAGVVLAGSLGQSAHAHASPDPPIAPGVVPDARGRPSVRLDKLVFPEHVAGARALERHFRYELKRAAKRADWGAARGAKIEYRVTVEELTVTERDGVLSVRCTAFGRLPRNKTARSHIVFGGNPRERQRVISHVLAIVARGVITRLAALERARRREHR
jgi:hypothetical protein